MPAQARTHNVRDATAKIDRAATIGQRRKARIVLRNQVFARMKTALFSHLDTLPQQNAALVEQSAAADESLRAA